MHQHRNEKARMLTTGDFATAHGSVNHVAWNVPADKLRDYRKLVKKAGVFASPILFHTDDTESGFEDKRHVVASHAALDAGRKRWPRLQRADADLRQAPRCGGSLVPASPLDRHVGALRADSYRPERRQR